MKGNDNVKLVTDFDHHSCEGVCLLRDKSKKDDLETIHVLGSNNYYICAGETCTRQRPLPHKERSDCSNNSRTLFLSSPLDIGEEQELLIADLVLGEDLLLS